MFIEQRFPTNVSWGAIGGCNWSTRVTKLDSGVDMRKAYYALTRGRWMISHKFRDTVEWSALIAFFRIARGRLFGFRFQDPTDYTSETYLGSGVSAGTVLTTPKNNLQLNKSYTLNDVFGNPFVVDRPIFKPAPDQTLTITSADGHTTRVGWSLDYTNGQVSGGGVVSGDTWTGQFDVPVRFDIDEASMVYEFYNNTAAKGGVSWPGISVVELRICEE